MNVAKRALRMLDRDLTSKPETDTRLQRDPHSGPEIRDLVALVAVASQPSLALAARSLGRRPAALRSQISKLERALGTTLVSHIRDPDRARLTEAGRLLLAHAEAVLARLGAAWADLDAVVERHPLRVGVYEAVVEHLMPTIEERLTGLSIAVREARDDADLLNWLEAGALELAFAALPLPRGPFEWIELVEEPYVLLAPASWSQSDRLDRLNIIELATTRLVSRRHSRSMAALEARLAAEGYGLRVVGRASSDAAVRALVGAGAGAAIVPRLSVDPADPSTVAIDLRALEPRPLALVWHRYRHLPGAAESFQAAARVACERLAAGCLGGSSAGRAAR